MVKTKIIEIGSMVPAFEEERLVILFGPSATAELKDICVIHEFEDQPKDALKVGGKIKFGDQEFTIEEVGSQMQILKNWDIFRFIFVTQLAKSFQGQSLSVLAISQALKSVA